MHIIHKPSMRLFNLVISFVLAIFLWLYVMATQDPSVTTVVQGVKVNVTGKDTLYAQNGYTVLNIEQDTLDVQVSGKRSVILSLQPEDIYLEADLSKINASGINSVQCSVVVPDSSLTVEDQLSLHISVNVDTLATKSVPVKLDYDTMLAEDEIIGTVSLVPETITLTGAESELEKINAAQVFLNDVVTDSVYSEELYVLTDASGEEIETQFTQASQDRVKVSVPVLIKKTLPVKVHIAEGGGLTGDNVTCEVSPNQITVAGESSALESISEITLADVDLSTLTKSTSFTEDISLSEGLINLSGVQTATVKVSMVNVSEKTLIIPTSYLTVMNVPEGFQAVCRDSEIQLHIWGGNSVISAVSSKNVKMVVDMTGVTDAGEYSLDLHISFSDLQTSPKLVGSYKLTLQLLEKQATEVGQS